LSEKRRKRWLADRASGRPVKDLVKTALAKRGYAIVQRSDNDIEPAYWDLWRQCAPYTMAGTERAYVLHKAIQHVVRQRIPGAIVECGVWRGGSSMMAALTLVQAGDVSRDIILYDTFEGMTRPTAEDLDASGQPAQETWEQNQRAGYNEWCYAPLEDVRANLRGTGYPGERIEFVRGKVEDTIPAKVPEQISVLRLDTDWYQSTRHELEHLYPRVSRGGVLLIDDYGAWAGARHAVDEYFERHPAPVLLHRVDTTGRIGVRVDAPGSTP
jgi:hypothetical protein